MNIDEAVRQVQDHLREKSLAQEGAHPNTEVEIMLWNNTAHGIRVAEVDFRAEGRPGIDNFISAGSCFMQSDVDGMVVCMAAERLLIELVEDGEPDEIESAYWRLDYLIFGEEV